MNTINLYKEQEIKYIKDNYKNTSLKELSKTLGRSISSISIKAAKLGLRKYYK